MEINWLFILVLIILVISLILGFRRGLVSVLFRLVSTLLSIVLSFFVFMAFGETIRTHTWFYDVVEGVIARYVTKLESGNVLLELVLNGESGAEQIAQTVSLAIFNVLLFAALFVIIRIILAIVNHKLNQVSGMPVLGTINRILGACLQLANGVLLIWLLFIFCDLISGTDIGQSALSCIGENRLLEELYDHNYLWYAMQTVLL